MKEKLFSLTKKDFDIQTFRSGGKGGQHQNTTDSGVRIIHRESGAVGESRSHKSQHQNKKAAMNRLVSTWKFKLWINRKAHEVVQGKTIEQEVEEMMAPENIKVEIKENGKWTQEV
jgi:protein subunit release factor B